MEKDLDYLSDGNFVINKQDLDEDMDGLTAENSDDSNCGDDGDGDVDGDMDGLGGIGAPLREQDRFLPIANVAKIMKRAIPDTGKIAKEARECVQECVSEFISFITSEASDRCHMEKRKTINGEDILFAMSTLGFDNYVEPLKLYLHKYREVAKTDRNVVTGAEMSGFAPGAVTSDTGNYSGEPAHTSHSHEHQTVIYTYHQPDNLHINF